MSISSLFDLTGKSVLITGAASGIGLAIAEVTAAAGASVFVTDLDELALQAQLEHLRQINPNIEGFKLDVSDTAQVEHAIDTVVTRSGKIDCVFANAGISAGTGFITEGGRLENIDDDVWDKVISVNLRGVMATMRAATRHMKQRKQGKVIVTSSIAGMRAEQMSGYAYVTSKAAVNNLVRQAALELASHNILVNAIAPGPFATGLNGGRLRSSEVVERMRTYVPLGRVAHTDEIKGLALLLASDASNYITGAVIPIDGGTSIRSA